MHQKRASRDGFPVKTCLVAASLLLMVLAISQVFAQQNRISSAARETSMADLMKLQGRLLGEGRNSLPVGPLKLTRYRVEELSLPQSVKMELRGKTVEVNKAWRVTIVGGPFQVRALPPVIWLNDVPLGYGIENESLSEISVITFDRSLLREGAAVSLSYGENKDARTELPERLTLIRTR
jgi:hypothetical protein